MNILNYVINGMVALGCFIAIFISIRNYLIIKENYKINKYSRESLKFCYDLVRTRDSFMRKNDGYNPCEVNEKIKFVKYFNEKNIFIKENL